jgi:anaerobic C4-dicarboxylate transporter DcuA
MIFLQLAVLLICIFIGARMSGIGLGVMGMIGLLILIFVFGMLPAAGLIVLFANTTATQITKASLFNSAAQATIAVFGVVWMNGTFMNHNYTIIQDTLGGLVTSYPWLFALALFIMSILLFSQAATTKALMPLGLSLGMAPAFLVGIFPAVNGHFFECHKKKSVYSYSEFLCFGVFVAKKSKS